MYMYMYRLDRYMMPVTGFTRLPLDFASSFPPPHGGVGRNPDLPSLKSQQIWEKTGRWFGTYFFPYIENSNPN